MCDKNNDWTTVGAKKQEAVKTVNRFVQQTSQDAKIIKTVYATGPKYYATNNVIVQESTNNRKPTLTPIDTSRPKTKKEFMQEKDKLLKDTLNEIYLYDEKKITEMLEEHKNNKQYDYKKGGLVANLKPILVSHYNKNNVNRYNVLSSQKFQDNVTDYFSQYDLDVVFNNDPDNEVWRIILYPQN